MGEMTVARFDVFLNPAANRGGAGKAWPAVETAIKATGRDVRCWRAGSRDEMVRQIGEAMAQGATDLVAAGGDGTFQTLLDAVVAAEGEPLRFRLGALAMGTSNDLHKPLDRAPKIGPGVPCRLDVAKAVPHDLIRFEATLPDGRTEVHHLIQSSSVGTIPTTNVMLTQGKGFAGLLYKVHYLLALLTTSTWVLCTYPGIRAEVACGTERFNGLYSGLTVLKRRHIAGTFEFATKRTCDDGLVDLGLCQKVGVTEMIGLVAAFEKSGFAGQAKVVFRELAELTAEFAEPQPIDYDGEIVVAKAAKWRVVPKTVNVMG